MPKQHTYDLKVFVENTDAGGVVYHANYLKFAERARTEYCNSIGIYGRRMMEDEGIAFVVSSQNVKYVRPAFLEDVLQVRSTIVQVKGASFIVEQDIYRGDTLIAQIVSKVAIMDMRTGRPVRVGEELAAKFSG
ncbi:MAG: acyl-CoA thioesterase [Alphaproteobacteria bacterium]|nr:acyl-CoA thioesterase [Alphaproteobacteria bacterium]